MLVAPSRLTEVISLIPGTALSWTSSGVAIADAIVSGLAPGRLALIWIVGNSAWGRGATGSRGKANTPSSTTPTVNRIVATG